MKKMKNNCRWKGNELSKLEPREYRFFLNQSVNILGIDYIIVSWKWFNKTERMSQSTLVVDANNEQRWLYNFAAELRNMLPIVIL